jgi:hypothetical protein
MYFDIAVDIYHIVSSLNKLRNLVCDCSNVQREQENCFFSVFSQEERV